MNKGAQGRLGDRKGGRCLCMHRAKVSSPGNCGRLRKPVRFKCGLYYAMHRHGLQMVTAGGDGGKAWEQNSMRKGTQRRTERPLRLMKLVLFSVQKQASESTFLGVRRP